VGVACTASCAAGADIEDYEAGLPDFSLYNKPEWKKYNNKATKLPNGGKIY
jgi:hypothetical protein